MRRHERLIVAAVVLGLFALWEALVRAGTARREPRARAEHDRRTR